MLKNFDLGRKPRSRRVLQFYEAIFLVFSLINIRNLQKLTFFGLIWPLNLFSVKFDWITVKMYPQKKIGGYGVTEWGFRGSLFWSKNHENAQNRAHLGPPKIPLSDPRTPKFFLWAHFDCNSIIFCKEKIWRSCKTKKCQFSQISSII